MPSTSRPAVAGQRPGPVQELPPGHLGALAAGGGGDGVRGGQLGHGQERGSQAGQEQAAGPRGGYELQQATKKQKTDGALMTPRGEARVFPNWDAHSV